MSHPASGRRLLAVLYLAGGLLLLDQLADLTATLIANDPSPGAATWRFGAFGLIASRVSVFLLADVMLCVAALGLEHRRVLRGLGALHLLLTPILLGGFVLFALDWLQVRGRVSQGQPARFDLAGGRAALLILSATVLCFWGGLSAYRAGKAPQHAGRRDSDAAPLLTAIPRKGRKRD